MTRMSTEDLLDFLASSFLHLLTLRYSYWARHHLWLLVSLRVAPESFPPCPVSCNTFLTSKVTRCPGWPRAKGLLDEGLAVLTRAQFQANQDEWSPYGSPHSQVTSSSRW